MEAESSIKTVPKKWGREEWIVNLPEYCLKYLYIDKGGASSLHYHNRKQETFYCAEGEVLLNIEGNQSILKGQRSRPQTIYPKEKHWFFGLTDSVILEVSTYHDEEDVVRLTESSSGD